MKHTHTYMNTMQKRMYRNSHWNVSSRCPAQRINTVYSSTHHHENWASQNTWNKRISKEEGADDIQITGKQGGSRILDGSAVRTQWNRVSDSEIKSLRFGICHSNISDRHILNYLKICWPTPSPASRERTGARCWIPLHCHALDLP